MLSRLKEYFYPGITSMDISPLDGTLMFYDRINSICPLKGTVLDYGAGSGRSIKFMPYSKQNLVLFKPNEIFRIGVDVEEDVLMNPYLDKSCLLMADTSYRMPILDETVDVVISDWVIEHLPSPDSAFEDIYRVLKPGGWFCARTANIYHYAYIIANLVKNTALERKLLNISQGEKYSWPKSYKANSKRKIKNKLNNAGFTKVVILDWETEPAYLMSNLFTFIFGVFWQKLATIGLLPKSTLMIFVQKPLN